MTAKAAIKAAKGHGSHVYWCEKYKGAESKEAMAAMDSWESFYDSLPRSQQADAQKAFSAERWKPL